MWKARFCVICIALAPGLAGVAQADRARARPCCSPAPGNAGNLGTFNPSEKTGMPSVSLWAKWNGLSTQWQGRIGKRGERKMVRPQRGRV